MKLNIKYATHIGAKGRRRIYVGTCTRGEGEGDGEEKTAQTKLNWNVNDNGHSETHQWKVEWRY